MIDTQLLGAATFLFGLVFGSFLNVCIHRLALRCYSDQELAARGLRRQDLSIVAPPSACPTCHHSIRWYDNVPVLSWVILRGRCRDCQAPISPRYAIVELLTAMLFLASYSSAVESAESFVHDPQLATILVTLKYCVFSFLIVGLIFTDAEHQFLPDALTLPGLALGLLFSLLIPVENQLGTLLLSWLPLPSTSERLGSLFDAALAAALGSSVFYGIGSAYLLYRSDLRKKGREALGFGDVKLMAFIGSFWGLKLLILTILIGSLAGSAVGLLTTFAAWLKKRRTLIERGVRSAIAYQKAARRARIVIRYYQLPFGVFLGVGALISAFAGETLLRWYQGLYR